MKHHNLWEPGTVRYRTTRTKLSPEAEEKLRRWRQRIDAELRRRFPDYFRR